MKCFRIFVIVLASLNLTCLVLPQNVYAYLDAGTGSYIIQVVIAAFVGGMFAVKVFWRKIKDFFSNTFSRAKKD